MMKFWILLDVDVQHEILNNRDSHLKKKNKLEKSLD